MQVRLMPPPQPELQMIEAPEMPRLAQGQPRRKVLSYQRLWPEFVAPKKHWLRYRMQAPRN